MVHWYSAKRCGGGNPMAFSTRCLTAAFVAALLSYAVCIPAAAAQPATAEPTNAAAKKETAASIVKRNAAAAGVIRGHGVVVDDLYAFIEPHQGEVQPPKDVHFTGKGYDMLGASWPRAWSATVALLAGSGSCVLTARMARRRWDAAAGCRPINGTSTLRGPQPIGHPAAGRGDTSHDHPPNPHAGRARRRCRVAVAAGRRGTCRRAPHVFNRYSHVQLSEAEPHWRKFLESLRKRGIHGVKPARIVREIVG
jgi:hypothetical protein